MILGALVQKLIFGDDVSGHFGFRAVAKIPRIFGRDTGAIFFYIRFKEVKPIVKTC